MTVQLDPVLLEVLACPAEHHAPLVIGAPGDPEAAALTCSECGRVFPVRDGIPVLLLDEAIQPGDVGAGTPAS
ncbi:Trm112 family protein [Nakamurella panacisegetis]